MEKLKCIFVEPTFSDHFTLGRVYNANSETSDFAVSDNFCSPAETAWEVEPDGVTVRFYCCDDSSLVIAKFENLKQVKK